MNIHHDNVYLSVHKFILFTNHSKHRIKEKEKKCGILKIEGNSHPLTEIE